MVQITMIIKGQFTIIKLVDFFHSRVAGEWILRCGGGVKFTRVDRYIWDYNALPEWPKNKYEVEGINAKDTYITNGGLDHLGRF